MDPLSGHYDVSLYTHRREIGNVTDYFDTIIKARHSHARVIVARTQCVCAPIHNMGNIVCRALYTYYTPVYVCTVMILRITTVGR